MNTRTRIVQRQFPRRPEIGLRSERVAAARRRRSPARLPVAGTGGGTAVRAAAAFVCSATAVAAPVAPVRPPALPQSTRKPRLSADRVLGFLREVFGGAFLPDDGDPRLTAPLEARLHQFARVCGSGAAAITSDSKSTHPGSGAAAANP